MNSSNVNNYKGWEGVNTKFSPVKTCDESKGHCPPHVESGEEEENNYKGGEEVKFREGGREEARRRDSEEACVAATPALHTLANCLCRSSSEVVEAHVEEQLHLLGEEDDMESQESEVGDPVKQSGETMGKKGIGEKNPKEEPNDGVHCNNTP